MNDVDANKILNGERIEGVLGITRDEFRHRLDNVDIWESMPKTEECDELMDMLSSYRDKKSLCILSHPINDSSLVGKSRWLNKFFPKVPVLLGRPKHFCAHSRAVLIDDFNGNFTDFKKYGGHAILYPRTWNAQKWRYKLLTHQGISINTFVMETLYKIEKTMV
jgi:hypothetical protein